MHKMLAGQGFAERFSIEAFHESVTNEEFTAPKRGLVFLIHPCSSVFIRGFSLLARG
jgi:hypothetical protein